MPDTSATNIAGVSDRRATCGSPRLNSRMKAGSALARAQSDKRHAATEPYRGTSDMRK
jgi:hypothetical protein